MTPESRSTEVPCPGGPTDDTDPSCTPSSPLGVLRSNLGAIGVMLTAVCLQVCGAVVLKTMADNRLEWSLVVLTAGIVAVLCLNLLRLGVWGFAHKRFPLSTTFPLSSLFYPVMLVVAAGFGDEIGMRQVMGALLIAAGTMWLSTRVPA